MEYILKIKRIRKKTKHWRVPKGSERLLSGHRMEDNTYYKVKK